MSVKALSHVWDKSKQKGASLLVLLAIADSANDDGFCWLAMPKLAKKARQSPNHTRNYVRKIEGDGEIIVYERKQEDDPRWNYSNLYKVVMPGVHGDPPDLKGKLRRRQPSVAETPVKNGGTDNIVGTPPPKSVRRVRTKLGDDPLLNPSGISEEIAPGGAPVHEDQSTVVTTPFEVGVATELYAGAENPAEDASPTKYPCSAADIKHLIAAWWDWVLVKPTQRGKVIAAKQHFANTTNREFAQTLIERGVAPADMIRFLADIRNNPESRWSHLRNRELTFVYAMECLQAWVKADREENFYTEDDPRITERRPDVRIDLGTIREGDNLLERLKDHPDLIVDVPRPYLDPQQPPDDPTDESPIEDDEDDATRLARLSELGIPL